MFKPKFNVGQRVYYLVDISGKTIIQAGNVKSVERLRNTSFFHYCLFPPYSTAEGALYFTATAAAKEAKDRMLIDIEILKDAIEEALEYAKKEDEG